MSPSTKSQTLTVRVRPEVKDALRRTAERERRSLANMLEVMIRAYEAPQAIAGAEGREVAPRAAAR